MNIIVSKERGDWILLEALIKEISFYLNIFKEGNTR